MQKLHNKPRKSSEFLRTKKSMLFWDRFGLCHSPSNGMSTTAAHIFRAPASNHTNGYRKFQFHHPSTSEPTKGAPKHKQAPEVRKHAYQLCLYNNHSVTLNSSICLEYQQQLLLIRKTYNSFTLDFISAPKDTFAKYILRAISSFKKIHSATQH